MAGSKENAVTAAQIIAGQGAAPRNKLLYLCFAFKNLLSRDWYYEIIRIVYSFD